MQFSIPLLELISALAIALIIWYGGSQVLAGVLTLGTLVAFIQYSDRFFRPISDLSEKYTILQAAMASSERIFKLLDTPPADRRPHQPQGAQRAKRQHRIPECQFCLQSRRTGASVIFPLRSSRDEKIAVVGATGAGKSTIICSAEPVSTTFRRARS